MTHTEFDSKVNIYRKDLHKYILSKTNDKDLTDDIVQTSMLKAYKYFKYDENKVNTIKKWLYQIAINCLIDHVKMKKKYNSRLLTFHSSDENNSDFELFIDDFNLENYIENKFYFEYIYDALDNLKNDKPDLYIVLKKYIDSYDMNSISSDIKIPLGTVKSRMHRARKYIENYLQEKSIARD